MSLTSYPQERAASPCPQERATPPIVRLRTPAASNARQQRRPRQQPFRCRKIVAARQAGSGGQCYGCRRSCFYRSATGETWKELLPVETDPDELYGEGG